MKAATQLSPDAFAWLCEMLLDETAIRIDVDKAYLVEARLLALGRAEGVGVSEVVAKARQEGKAGDTRRKIVEAMTTNETSFFRDPRIFSALVGDVLSAVFRDAPVGEVRIWCAASSTGQEPYSLAMALRERYPDHAGRVRLVATDVDTQALHRAREGAYSQLEVNRGLPARYLIRYFEKVGLRWSVKDEVKRMVDFKQLNLIKDQPPASDLHLVLIRNVLIYFSQEKKAEVLTRAARNLGHNGMLVLGGTESILGCNVPLAAEKFGACTVYRRAGVAAEAHGTATSTRR